MIQCGSYKPIFSDGTRRFRVILKCYSILMTSENKRLNLQMGGKIIMPASALDILTRSNIPYPMLFKLINQKRNRVTHAGVLEFIAGEGQCFLPKRVMRNLQLKEGDAIIIENASLPVATFLKFRPHKRNVFKNLDETTMVKRILRQHACLTTGDVISVHNKGEVYKLRVLETRPGNSVCVGKCDLDVEFKSPFGHEGSILVEYHPYKVKKIVPCAKKPTNVKKSQDTKIFLLRSDIWSHSI